MAEVNWEELFSCDFIDISPTATELVVGDIICYKNYEGRKAGYYIVTKINYPRITLVELLSNKTYPNLHIDNPRSFARKVQTILPYDPKQQSKYEEESDI